MASATHRGRMIVNDTDYTGSFVDPNPSGVATDDLNTVAIDGKIFNVVGSRGGGTSIILNGQIYSTEEKVVGIWKNNKPLYQKTCVFGSVSGQTANLSLGIANIEEAFLCADASYVNDSTCPLPYVTGTSYANNIGGFFDIGVSDTSFAIRIGQSMSGSVNNVVLTVRYTKTTDTAGSGGFQAYGFTPVIYSTEEREVGVWTDGKPIYKRTWLLSNEVLVNSNGTTISEIDASMVEHLIDCNGGYQPLSNTKSIPILAWKYNNTWYYGSSINAYIDTVTLTYTKTTDVAGSGQYTTLGVPAVHYDGNEKIVGTYYGETLYEKSYIQQLNNGETQISISDLNANYAFIESGFYDIGVTKLALNEIIDINSRLYTYTHINTGSQYLNIDCKNTVSTTSTIHITIRYTKTTD